MLVACGMLIICDICFVEIASFRDDKVLRVFGKTVSRNIMYKNSRLRKSGFCTGFSQAVLLFVLDLIICYLATCILGAMVAVVLDVLGYVWRDGDVFVHDISNYGDSLAHGEGCEDGADS